MSHRKFGSLAQAAALRLLRVELARKEHEVEQLTEQVGALQAAVKASEGERLLLAHAVAARREREQGQGHARELAAGFLQAETRERTRSPLRFAQALAAQALLLPR